MRPRLGAWCAASALGLALSAPVLAQQPVVEDLTDGSGSFYDQTATREQAGGSLVLFNEVQRNQEEIRRLRGQVEELRYQLEQLKRQTRQQYLDLDERLGAGPATPPPAGDTPSQEATASGDGAAAPEPGNGQGDDEAGVRQAYQAAFAKVQSREFEAATAAFEAFIADHPDTRLTANAHYWLGELHSAASELDRAETAFRRVLDDFPDSNKVPDALYKLGLLKARQGDPEASRELLERVRSDYPDSSAASLAADFLRQSGN
ncbi:tol-pal system protein YbgF [Halomonas beimenensis]|uniref:Cell division coordinator CpoB n=1 Tax=Halomonas beimenensis TaxID=475662 RepID=A0A291P7H1_9GAMM|nr:tol-pal system protein YbgF [Halomonas beimenensis]ATJ82844.1 Tol-Pal system TPR repeat containing exported protein YbgF [Halomonas beimenensis]